MATVLIVEPSRNLRLLLEEELTERGHHVHATGTPTDALACIARGGLDLVVIEVVMPGMDGLRLLGRLLGAGRQLPVIVYTASAHRLGSIARSLADACVLKSSDLQPLLAAVARVLRRTEFFSAPWRAVDFSSEHASLATSPL